MGPDPLSLGATMLSRCPETPYLTLTVTGVGWRRLRLGQCDPDPGPEPDVSCLI